MVASGHAYGIQRVIDAEQFDRQLKTEIEEKDKSLKNIN